MEQPTYEQCTVIELRKIARNRQVKLPAGIHKADIIRKLSGEAAPVPPPAAPPVAPPPMPAQHMAAPFAAQDSTYTRRATGYYNEEYGTSNPAVPEMLAAGMCGDGGGILELQPDGYGFLRANNCTPGREDVYVSIAQIRRFSIKNGDLVCGKTRPRREGDRYSALMYIESINGKTPGEAVARRAFDSLTPIHPNRRLTLESPTGGSDLAIRMLDFIAPIGLGQRALIVAPPKAGKTILLKKIAQAITHCAPDVHLMLLLIDERPEEVTDIQREVSAEVMYSTFDAPPENHIRVSEMVYERAQRLVEQGRDVVVLMDSLTRLSRAYNAAAPQSGRALSGGLAPGVLQKPKRFFGAARNLEEGGSLTIIATVLVDTGSRMDEIIFEEFKGTGNAEIQLDRSLSERRVFPAIDLARSGTRREELLLGPEELEGVRTVRQVLSSNAMGDATEQLMGMLVKTRTNREFFARLLEWVRLWEKEGYTLAARGGRTGRGEGLTKKNR